jgi:hypothetical protein
MEIIAVCSQICTNVKYILGQNIEFIMLSMVVRNVTTEVKKQDDVAELASTRLPFGTNIE